LLSAESLKLTDVFSSVTGITAVSAIGESRVEITQANKKADRERLDKEIERIEAELQTVEAKLQNKSFVDRAPAVVVEEHRRRLADFTAQLAKLRQARADLQ
jgi:valyl-tRNA synthetase